MGISKAMAEKVVIARARVLQGSETVFCITRYGNVMGSRGSVIPLFISQIKKQAPLTITDQNMTRFLMSLNESVELVLFALSNGKQGDLFVQKAPASTIGDLAEAIKQIFNSQCRINVIGTRHGEKLYESLISREEMAIAEDLGSYYRIPADNRDLNYSLYFSEGQVVISEQEDYTSHNTRRLIVSQIKDLLLTLDCVKEKLNA